MGIAVLLAIILAGIQKHPFGYIAGEEPIVTVIPVSGTTYVMGEFLATAYHHNLYLGINQECLLFLILPIRLSGRQRFPQYVYVLSPLLI